MMKLGADNGKGSFKVCIAVANIEFLSQIKKLILI